MAFIGTAQAQPDVIATSNGNWVGFYFGGNIGGGWSTTCDNWETANVVTVNPLIVHPSNAFYYRACPSSGDNSITTCTGSAATCTAFGNVKLDNTHNSFTANLFRVGINYRI